MYSNSYGRGSEAYFEQDERLCVCGGGGLTEVITDTEYDVTFEARPLCNSTRCTALLKSDITMKIRNCVCLSIKY